ncbi:hypothetical protein DPMN_186863 [Dreissena polymorpha]|uniref:Uncharacterized protein n=1 Tax=Dreissena polymorpha TaxID=45954 RepID=A0A9D4I9Y4_DREPO|nr:hypothetical protein DPMN_186863 [Dreissena polymorpha]
MERATLLQLEYRRETETPTPAASDCLAANSPTSGTVKVQFELLPYDGVSSSGFLLTVENNSLPNCLSIKAHKPDQRDRRSAGDQRDRMKTTIALFPQAASKEDCSCFP